MSIVTKISVFETCLDTGKKEKVSIEIYEGADHYLKSDSKNEGDIYQTNGTIRYVFNKVPECLFYSSNRTNVKTALSHN